MIDAPDTYEEVEMGGNKAWIGEISALVAELRELRGVVEKRNDENGD